MTELIIIGIIAFFITSHFVLWHAGYAMGRRSVRLRRWRIKWDNKGNQFKITCGPEQFINFTEVFRVDNIEQARESLDMAKQWTETDQ